tara:strand:- start:47 stop:226 length:180 start_codon:yes stop_codon:yes gene_type:complete
MMSSDIKVTEIEEHEDGSATMQLELDPETYAALFNVGFVYSIRKGIEQANPYLEKEVQE